MKPPRHEVDYLPLSITEIKNEWSYTSTPPYTFMAWTGKNLSLFFILSFRWHIKLSPLQFREFFFSMGTVSEKTKFHKPAPIAYVQKHAPKHTSFMGTKEDYLALFSQLMNRLSRNVGKDLPQLAVSWPRTAQFL
jgi:hypothetical protein